VIIDRLAKASPSPTGERVGVRASFISYCMDTAQIPEKGKRKHGIKLPYPF
jgi:hypothetical protein